jgi:hypothetical protein
MASGYIEESKSMLLHSPALIFYGRYIDDALVIVYAESEQQALAYCETINIYNCTLTWSASDWAIPFLDMHIYKDTSNKLQHMPYRKARNSHERIPWITSHPITVRRGTFVGELSRMATLSSTYDVYLDAVKGIVGLYTSRGYPYDIVIGWTKKYIKERWQKRIYVAPQEAVRSASDVLVLKSEYNLAWDYFSATALGNTMMDTWRNGIDASLSTTWHTTDYRPFDDPKYGSQIASSSRGQLFDCDPEFLTEFRVTDGTGVAEMPDLRKLGFLDKRFLVSKKRTRNLYDLTSLWKKTVLAKMEQTIFENPVDDSAIMDGDDVVMENATESPQPERRWSPTRQLGHIDLNSFLDI